MHTVINFEDRFSCHLTDVKWRVDISLVSLQSVDRLVQGLKVCQPCLLEVRFMCS